MCEPEKSFTFAGLGSRSPASRWIHATAASASARRANDSKNAPISGRGSTATVRWTIVPNTPSLPARSRSCSGA
jgi:hypothetical protein